MTDLSRYEKAKEKNYYKKLGKVLNVVGLTIESAGPDARLADICYIHPEGDNGPGIMAEVVGFRDGRTLLMPYENTEGIGIGNLVENTGESLHVSVGDFLLGKMLDGLGRPAAGDFQTEKDWPYGNTGSGCGRRFACLSRERYQALRDAYRQRKGVCGRINAWCSYGYPGYDGSDTGRERSVRFV